MVPSGLEQEVGSGRLWPGTRATFLFITIIIFSFSVIHLNNTCIKAVIEVHRKCKDVVLNGRFRGETTEHKRLCIRKAHLLYFIYACLFTLVSTDLTCLFKLINRVRVRVHTPDVFIHTPHSIKDT